MSIHRALIATWTNCLTSRLSTESSPTVLADGVSRETMLDTTVKSYLHEPFATRTSVPHAIHRQVRRRSTSHVERRQRRDLMGPVAAIPGLNHATCRRIA